jgi:WD40 repeat protein
LKFKASFIGHKNWIRSGRFNGDATLIASGGEDKRLLLWDV